MFNIKMINIWIGQMVDTLQVAMEGRMLQRFIALLNKTIKRCFRFSCIRSSCFLQRDLVASEVGEGRAVSGNGGL